MTSVPQIAVTDILDLVAYEKQRPETRKRMIAERALRRVPVGPVVSLHFENRDTVWYQVQEMCRIERVVDEARVQDEIDAYADLLPLPGDLGVTMMIELDGEARLREWLPRLVGIEHALAFEVAGADTTKVVGDTGRSTDETTAAVHYLRLPVTPSQETAMRAGAECAVSVDHPNYQHRGVLPARLVAALVADLASVAE